MRLPRRIPLASDPATITVSRLFVSTRARQRATNSFTSGVGMSRVDVIRKFGRLAGPCADVSAVPDSATITDSLYLSKEPRHCRGQSEEVG